MECDDVAKAGLSILAPGSFVYGYLKDSSNGALETKSLIKTIGIASCAITLIGLIAVAIGPGCFNRSWIDLVRNLSCPWKKAGALVGVSILGALWTISFVGNGLCLFSIIYDNQVS